MLSVWIEFKCCHNSCIIAFSAATGKDDLRGIGIDELCYSLPGLLKFFAHISAKRVHTGGISVLFRKIGKHLLQDFRCYPCGGIIIGIYNFHGFLSPKLISGYGIDFRLQC